MKSWKNVDEYVAAAPKEVRPKLERVRAAIREVAPDAVEGISYGMPFYSYKGEQGIEGRLCYFGLVKSGIGLYLRPPVIEEHMDELGGYKTTKSALQLPLVKAVPVSLIKELVRDAMKRHQDGGRSRNTTGSNQGSGRVMDPLRAVAGTWLGFNTKSD